LHITHLILGDWDELPTIYRRLPLVIPAVISFSAIGIGVMRIVHFIGTAKLFHLLVGTYHRPVLKRAVLMFIDMNSSTAVAVRPRRSACVVTKAISRLRSASAAEIWWSFNS
jgi:adenylate cyclase